MTLPPVAGVGAGLVVGRARGLGAGIRTAVAGLALTVVDTAAFGDVLD